mmetsp:Transcript_14366/g.58126  ORF Transcript_14366/g.58126 Transcript_14366/m.58126 type:complete len:115 (-) Transcript_14366:1881-2225(-)
MAWPFLRVPRNLVLTFCSRSGFSRNPLQPDMNPIYYAIFFFVPSYALLYAATLLPAWRIQKWPTSLFLALSTAIGSVALLPYLGLRNYTTQPDPDFTKVEDRSSLPRSAATGLD